MKTWVIEPDETCVTSLLKDLATEMVREGRLPPDKWSKGPVRIERRLYPRVPCLLLVDYATEDGAYRAFVRNISADGAFIEARTPVLPNEPVISLVISLPEGRTPVRIRGKVLWSGEQGIGVRFNPLSQIGFDDLPR